MITVDIETYKDVSDPNYISWKLSNIKAPSNYKDPVAIERNIGEQKLEALEKFALNPLTGRIILIGILLDKIPPLYEEKDFIKYSVNGESVYYIGFDDADEVKLLSKWWQLFSWYTLNDSLMVTYNGKQFDLPFILHRSIILNVKIPRKIQMKNYLSKYDHSVHFDGFNWFGSGSLVEWSYRLGAGDSLQRDGGKIGGWYEAGKMDLIKDKNKIDLAQSYSIYQKVKDFI